MSLFKDSTQSLIFTCFCWKWILQLIFHIADDHIYINSWCGWRLHFSRESLYVCLRVSIWTRCPLKYRLWQLLGSHRTSNCSKQQNQKLGLETTTFQKMASNIAKKFFTLNWGAFFRRIDTEVYRKSVMETLCLAWTLPPGGDVLGHMINSLQMKPERPESEKR